MRVTPAGWAGPRLWARVSHPRARGTHGRSSSGLRSAAPASTARYRGSPPRPSIASASVGGGGPVPAAGSPRSRGSLLRYGQCPGCRVGEGLEEAARAEAEQFFRGGHGVATVRHTRLADHGWRSRARLAVRDQNGVARIGLFRPGTHEVVECPDCRVHHQSINAAVARLKQIVVERGVEGYREGGGGLLRYVQLDVNSDPPAGEGEAKGAVRVVLVWNLDPEAELPAAARGVIEDLCAREAGFGLHSVWSNFQSDPGNNAVLGPVWRREAGRQWLWERHGDADVAFSPGSFTQVRCELLATRADGLT